MLPLVACGEETLGVGRGVGSREEVIVMIQGTQGYTRSG